MTSPEETPTGPSLTEMLDLVVEDNVNVYLHGLQGQMIAGKLSALLVDNLGLPAIVQIEQPDKPKLNIPWASVIMIVRRTEPLVEVEAPMSPDLRAAVEHAKSQGIEVPEEVQLMLDTDDV